MSSPVHAGIIELTMGADSRQSFVSQYYTGHLPRGNVRILCSLLQTASQGTHPTGRLFGASTSLATQEQGVSDYDPGHTLVHNKVFHRVQGLKVVALNPDVASGKGQGQLRVRQGQTHPGFTKIHPQPHGCL